jgi:hypothetical protein
MPKLNYCQDQMHMHLELLCMELIVGLCRVRVEAYRHRKTEMCQG